MKYPIALISSLIILFLTNSTFAQNLRITPEQLKQELTKQIILDARTNDAYQAGHIKGALNFPVNLTYQNNSINGKIAKPAKMQALFRALGITKNSPIIVYDYGDMVDAARLFWVLEVYGLEHIKILDHGYDYWLSKDYAISLENTTTRKSDYVPTLNHQHLASKFTTQLATRNTNQVVIDARSRSDYLGQTSTAKRYGHIPTAVHIAASHNLSISDGMTHLKPINELKKLYKNIPKDKKIVIYCAIGRVSSMNYLALRELGYNVANYDASWNEWGNDSKLPIEKATEHP